MAPPDAPPLILTLALDPDAQADFDQQRRRHFPPARNHIPAHITLFHALPGDQLASIRSTLDALAQSTEGFPLTVAGLQPLGRGVAYAFHPARPLLTLHAHLAQAWHPWLTRQDQQPLRPHVVIQNKVSAPQAQALLGRLSPGFRPWTITATGLLLWRYLGGPWALEESFPFASPALNPASEIAVKPRVV
ncbi:MAG TPA: 2'-5' RNA ligase family protein [Acidobacteriaceae bacterium]